MSNSHLWQEIGNHVTLWGYTTGQDKLGSPIWKFGRIYPDGVVDSSAFNVPEGKALVVTDVDWNYNTGEHNETQIFSMYMKMPKKNI